MKTEDTTETLETLAAALGVTIETSAPQPGVDPAETKESKPWPHIAYVVTLSRNGRKVWEGPYKLGIGHVKAPSGCKFPLSLSMYDWKRLDPAYAPGMKYDELAEARIAAKLAKAQNVAPKLTDVLSSLLSDGSAYFDAETFEDWCANFGYDTDSRRAEATWKACDEVGRQLARAFTTDELAQLREAASNY